MNTSIGVNSFRSSFHIAARAVSKSIPATSGRCFSTLCPLRLRTASYDVPGWSRLPPPKSCPAALTRRIGLRTFKILPGNVVTTNYVDLPPNYTDEGGLPFRRVDLDAREIMAIFGTDLSTLAGNKLLKILHGRRVAGTLDDPDVQIHTRLFSKKQQEAALKYLREYVAVDEVANAGLRAEDELAALESMEDGQEAANGEAEGEKTSDLGYTSRIKLFKDAPQTQEEIYGMGAFEKIRAANKARWEEELKRREEEKKRKEEEEAKSNPGGLAKIDPNAPRVPSVKMQEYLTAGQSDLQAPPEMTKWERLLPATILVLVTCAVWFAYAQFYQPPTRANRLWPDIPPAAATIGAIVLTNLFIYAAWKVPPLWPVLNKHFILTSATPRLAAILGSMFSHQTLGHLFMNMVPLWLFGTRLHDEVGRGNFLAIYFGTGTMGFLGTLYTLVLRGRLDVSTLGASGAVFGSMAAYLWLHRFDYFKLFELPPDPFNGIQGLGILAFVLALHIPHVLSRKKHNIDVASHLVGMATGVAGGHYLETKLRSRAPFHQQQQIHMGPAVVGHGVAREK